MSCSTSSVSRVHSPSVGSERPGKSARLFQRGRDTAFKDGIILLLLIVSLAAESPVVIGGLPERFKRPSTYVDETGFKGPSTCVDETGSHPDGSTWYLEGCRMGECQRSGMGMLTTHFSCYLESLPDGCEVVQDNTLNFPDCCPTAKCS
ncbi:uncharacterized protein LOC125029861 [Penaeus chinensis]|uniref:uncharacterized protein LOC125029861 n=1 Tax=Penaeus chinensis TaxID=139456 RepID=UPI001FB693F1|nr:uncharacterized protein LOC125029861 [Penaeus chinensis]